MINGIWCTELIRTFASIRLRAYHIPTVNIGDGQRGRLRASSVFDCRADEKSIRDTIGLALSEKGQKIARECDNPYGDSHAAERIVEKSISFLGKDIDLKKQFYVV